MMMKRVFIFYFMGLFCLICAIDSFAGGPGSGRRKSGGGYLPTSGLSLGKTKYVNGYYKDDGTYVEGYYRRPRGSGFSLGGLSLKTGSSNFYPQKESNYSAGENVLPYENVSRDEEKAEFGALPPPQKIEPPCFSFIFFSGFAGKDRFISKDLFRIDDGSIVRIEHEGKKLIGHHISIFDNEMENRYDNEGHRILKVSINRDQ